MKSKLIPDGTGRDQIRRPPPKSLAELKIRAEALNRRSVQELATGLGFVVPEDNVRSKGFVGQLVERALGADPSAGELPDFTGLEVELKTIPVRTTGAPVESTFCCSIAMDQADRETWEGSRLKRRLTRVLWLPVDGSSIAPMAERCFGKARLWQPSDDEMAVLQADWEDLMGAIGSGRGGTLSAREGEVLQVRPKAANSYARTVSPGGGGFEMSLPLGFYLRAGSTARILEQGTLLA